jgi:hypothetical protein
MLPVDNQRRVSSAGFFISRSSHDLQSAWHSKAPPKLSRGKSDFSSSRRILQKLGQPSIYQHDQPLPGRAVNDFNDLFCILGFENPRRVIGRVLPITERARCAVYQNLEAELGVHRPNAR